MGTHLQAFVEPHHAKLATAGLVCCAEREHAEGDNEVSDLHSGRRRLGIERRSLLAQFDVSVVGARDDGFSLYRLMSEEDMERYKYMAGF